MLILDVGSFAILNQFNKYVQAAQMEYMSVIKHIFLSELQNSWRANSFHLSLFLRSLAQCLVLKYLINVYGIVWN